MKSAKFLIFLSACVLLAGCGKGSNTNNANAVVNTAGTTNATASPKATVEAAKSPASTTNLQGKVSKPEEAAEGLFNAWKTKDRTAAAKFASNDAITTLFSEGSPQGLQFQGCTEGQDTGYDCGYSYEGGGLIMHVTGNATDGYKVVATGFIAD